MMTAQNKNKHIAWVCGVVTFLALLGVISLANKAFTQNAPSPLEYILAHIFTLVVWFIPGFQYMLWAEKWFGLTNGIIYTIIGQTLGCFVCYGLTYSLGPSAIKIFRRRVIWPKKKTVSAELILAIIVLRQVFLFPAQILTYGSGLIRIPFSIYAPVITVANIPVCTAYVVYGQSLKFDFASIGLGVLIIIAVFALNRRLLNCPFQRLKDRLPKFEPIKK